MTTEDEIASEREMVDRLAESISKLCHTVIARRLGQFFEVIQEETAKEPKKLRAEIKRLRAVLEPASDWFSSVEDTRGTQAAIDAFRDAARAALHPDVPPEHDPKCRPDFPFHLCPVCYPGL